MKKVVVGVLSSAGIAACSNAANDTQAQTQQAQSTLSAGGDAGDPAHRHHGPPPAAFDACTSKAAGDPCSITFGTNTLTGTCVAPPSGAPDARIACRPAKMPDGDRPHGPPPAEIFTACEGKTADAACTVNFGDHSVNGTCRPPPPFAPAGETRLACVPPHD